MPILGLTDRGALFPEIGHLRKGAKKESEKKPGADLTYFRFETEDAEAAQIFEEVYGKEPRVIRAFLPFKTKWENFSAWREEWSASSLKHRCDGQTMSRWLTPHGTYSDEPSPCPYAGKPKSEKGCKATARLKIIIPDLCRLACVTVHTTSDHDILQIDGNLDALIDAHGGLQGIPLLLRRSKRMISTPGADGKRVRREKWLISIEAQRQWVELQLIAQERAALPQAEPLALPEWDGEEDDDESETDGSVNLDTLAAIEKLWPKYGQKLGGKVTSFADYLHQKKGITDPRQMPAEDAKKMLEWLQSKALTVDAALVEEAETVSV